MLHGGGVLGQADQVVVALLLGALHLLQAVEAGPRAHAGGAARLALPLLHPAPHKQQVSTHMGHRSCMKKNGNCCSFFLPADGCQLMRNWFFTSYRQVVILLLQGDIKGLHAAMVLAGQASLAVPVQQ